MYIVERKYSLNETSVVSNRFKDALLKVLMQTNAAIVIRLILVLWWL